MEFEKKIVKVPLFCVKQNCAWELVVPYLSKSTSDGVSNSKFTNLGKFSFQEQHKNQAMYNHLEDLRLLHLSNWLYLKQVVSLLSFFFFLNLTLKLRTAHSKALHT